MQKNKEFNNLLPQDTTLYENSEFVIEDKETINFYPLEKITNKVVWGNAFNVLPKLAKESFDLIFIDPPYFLQLPKKELRRWNVNTVVEGVDDEWDKFQSFEDYDNFITKLLTLTKNLMKPNATIWVISTYHSIFRIGKIMQDLGFWILNDIVWVKTNPMPNWLGVRFTNATEHLIWAVKDKETKKYKFNKEYAKMFGIGNVGANVWFLPICQGNERLKDKTGKKLHSTQKPIELLKRVILTSSAEGDFILDPMAGTGTTGFVAKELKRNFVMVELNPNYIAGIKERFTKQFLSERNLNKNYQPHNNNLGLML
ncbi:MAG: DNA methyltransferase [Ignavibacteria bacterium]|nr:DNA methyltransferase [Ignavibacteria bacterium]